MHKVSENTVLLAQKHALEAFEYGKAVEGIGKRLQTDNLWGGGEIGQSLEESAKTIQDKAEVLLGKTQKLAEDNSIEVFLEYLSTYVDMTNSYVEAVNKFIQRGRHATTKEMINDHN